MTTHTLRFGSLRFRNHTSPRYCYPYTLPIRAKYALHPLFFQRTLRTHYHGHPVYKYNICNRHNPTSVLHTPCHRNYFLYLCNLRESNLCQPHYTFAHPTLSTIYTTIYYIQHHTARRPMPISYPYIYQARSILFP